MPKFIREAIVDKYGQKTFVKFDKKQIRLAGSIAQAEIENLNGIFTLSRQKKFADFIVNQKIGGVYVPTILIGDLFSILEGILVEMANPVSHGTPEQKHALRIQVTQLLFDVNIFDPSRL